MILEFVRVGGRSIFIIVFLIRKKRIDWKVYFFLIDKKMKRKRCVS